MTTWRKGGAGLPLGSRPPGFAAQAWMALLSGVLRAVTGGIAVAFHGTHLRRWWGSRGSRRPGVRRRLMPGLLVVLSAALAVAGTAGTVRYIGTFWVYRGFAAPSTAPSVAVSGPGGRRYVRVVRRRWGAFR
jgi:hypothetical protein